MGNNGKSEAKKEAELTPWERGKFEYEVMQTARGQSPEKTGYPAPLSRYTLITENFNMSIEENYFWILNHIREWGMRDVIKVSDIFTASEQSAFWGQSQQRLSTQQSLVSSYMQTINKLIRELIQITHDMRIYDEKLGYFDDANKGKEAAWVTLKGMWVDQVEGGTKSAQSVIGMAQQVGFTTLPDLFFSIHPKKSGEVDKIVDTMAKDFNRKVREVLRRKLYQFLKWKEENEKEIRARRTFTVRFLKQHYSTIQMYISWVKPYLKNVMRLTMNEKKLIGPDLVGAFEGSSVEIEILCREKPKFKETFPVVLVSFDFITKASMDYTQDRYQQRGPIHVGRLEMNFRSYAWTQGQIDCYLKYRERETLEVLAQIDSSLKSAMDALGDDVRHYIDERESEDLNIQKGMVKDDAKKYERRESKGILDPFMAVLLGFVDIGFSVTGRQPKSEVKCPRCGAINRGYLVCQECGKILPKVEKKKEDTAEKGAAEGKAKAVLWQAYKNYKKSHGFTSW